MTPDAMTADPVPDAPVLPTLEDLARDICSLAQRAGMPDTYWETDTRIARACLVLGISPADARAADWSRRPDPAPSDLPEDPGSLLDADPVVLLESDPDFDQSTTPTAPDNTAETTRPTEVWTDGACRHNPGPGGWGWITPDGRHGSGALPGTTNNVMEITAALEAIKSVPERPLVVVSDSRYVVDAFEKRWWSGWIKRGWKTSGGDQVKNRDLWIEIIDLVVFGGVSHAENPDRKVVDTGITFRWVKGHANWPLNEAADRLAVAARETLPDEPRQHRGGGARRGGRGR